MSRWIFAALVACCAYVLTYTLDFTPFYYYPIIGEWHLTPQAREAGPGITYYAWQCVGLAAGWLALWVPARWTARLPVAAVWVGSLLLMAIVVAHEAHWFFGA